MEGFGTPVASVSSIRRGSVTGSSFRLRTGDALAARAEKSAVVIDLGAYEVKCGFAGEPKPRCSIQATPNLQRLFKVAEEAEDHLVTKEDWLNEVLMLFRTIYFVYLDTKPKDRKVHVALYHYAPRDLHWACGEALLEYFQVPSLLISSASGLAMFPTGLLSGLVVDMGHVDSRCVAIADGAVIDRSFKTTCSTRQMPWEELVQVETLDEDSLIVAILESIRNCPAPIRPVIVQNVVLCGGGLIPMYSSNSSNDVDKPYQELKDRLLAVANLDMTRYEEVAHIVKTYFKITALGVPSNHVVWLGLSVSSCLDSFTSRSVTLEMFQKYPFIFDSTNLELRRLLDLAKSHGREVTLEQAFLGKGLDELLLNKRKSIENDDKRSSLNPPATTEDDQDQLDEDPSQVIHKYLIDPPIISK